jgi:hypothetical protein
MAEKRVETEQSNDKSKAPQPVMLSTPIRDYTTTLQGFKSNIGPRLHYTMPPMPSLYDDPMIL